MRVPVLVGHAIAGDQAAAYETATEIAEIGTTFADRDLIAIGARAGSRALGLAGKGADVVPRLAPHHGDRFLFKTAVLRLRPHALAPRPAGPGRRSNPAVGWCDRGASRPDGHRRARARTEGHHPVECLRHQRS